ncbi:MAG TPA: hypothetical protein P5572_01445 [Phycisphaerae bacterium]|nr:hypothetical protein [Phycisphaerales bacterium]HRX83663.1 hypothetical protein [Phycisphaerae bacterium]
MSTLTKIFVVLMVVFSIAFTMSTIGFVAKTNKWRDLAQKYRDEAQVVQVNMRNLAASHAAEKTVWVDSKRSLDDRIADLSGQVERVTADLVDARQQLDKLGTEKSNADARVDQLLAQLDVERTGRQEQAGLRETAEKRNQVLETRNAELNTRLEELSARIVVLVQQQRQLEQQVNILKDENSKMADAGGGNRVSVNSGRSSAPSAAPIGVAPIRGEIVEVAGNLATISVGSADGVRDGMVFVIYRGSEYIGDLKVTEVEPNQAAGELVKTRATPRASDQVADEPALGLAQ